VCEMGPVLAGWVNRGLVSAGAAEEVWAIAGWVAKARMAQSASALSRLMPVMYFDINPPQFNLQATCAA